MAKDRKDLLTLKNMLIGGGVLTFVITAMSGGGILEVFSPLHYMQLLRQGVTFLGRAVSSGGQNEKTLNIVTSVVCLAVPLLMAQQEWDDHDRSRKTTGPDMAKAYLESCAPNAVIFTFGDNDTYPLWLCSGSRRCSNRYPCY